MEKRTLDFIFIQKHVGNAFLNGIFTVAVGTDQLCFDDVNFIESVMDATKNLFIVQIGWFLLRNLKTNLWGMRSGSEGYTEVAPW